MASAQSASELAGSGQSECCLSYPAAEGGLLPLRGSRETHENSPLIVGNIKNLTLFERKYETSSLIEGGKSPFDWEKIQMIIIELYSCIVIGAIIEKKADFIVKKTWYGALLFFVLLLPHPPWPRLSTMFLFGNLLQASDVVTRASLEEKPNIFHREEQ